MKNNIDYYRHKVDAHNHWKFKTLRRKYGWAGDGKFWAFNNLIGDSDNCMLDLTEIPKKMAIAAELDFSREELEEFIIYLHKDCLLIKVEGHIITTEMVQEVFDEVDTRRQKQRDFKKSKSLEKTNNSLEKTGKSTEKEPFSTIENEQSKVKETIVKEIKGNNKDLLAPAAPTDQKGLDKKTETKKFVKPSLQEVIDYFILKIGDPKNRPYWPEDKCKNEAAKLFDHYKACGWKQGRGKPIVDWQAACRNWVRNAIENAFGKTTSFPPTEPPPSAQAPPKEPEAPRLSKNHEEINYLYGRYQEKQITVISIEAAHYDFLKNQGVIKFTPEQRKNIESTALAHLNEKRIPVTEPTKLRFMKCFGVLEYFQQLQDNGQETVFELQLIEQ